MYGLTESAICGFVAVEEGVRRQDDLVVARKSGAAGAIENMFIRSTRISPSWVILPSRRRFAYVPAIGHCLSIKNKPRAAGDEWPDLGHLPETAVAGDHVESQWATVEDQVHLRACLRPAEGQNEALYGTIGIGRAKVKVGMANIDYNILQKCLSRSQTRSRHPLPQQGRKTDYPDTKWTATRRA